ncbi:hypothetical protein CEXT_212321 [Caerostris extrusa]|uniref:Transposase n=1 Tax=Caerostris extrusa TaxID=172846 RepID=A0AAV4WWG8_CAEEX|nr:hypothetical protein CEXT_212321 [Caerostris extrusa]
MDRKGVILGKRLRKQKDIRLPGCLLHILTNSHDNAKCERIFNNLRKIGNNFKRSLLDEKPKKLLKTETGNQPRESYLLTLLEGLQSNIKEKNEQKDDFRKQLPHLCTRSRKSTKHFRACEYINAENLKKNFQGLCFRA